MAGSCSSAGFSASPLPSHAIDCPFMDGPLSSPPTGAARQSVLTRACIVIVRLYQGCIRPHLIGSCKFCPTCSEYAVEALTTLGWRRGGWVAFRRVLRCHPFSRGGIDPVFLSQARSASNQAS